MGAFTPPENHSEAHKKALAVSDELVARTSCFAMSLSSELPCTTLLCRSPQGFGSITSSGLEKTFSYKRVGVEGHAGGRKVIVTVASGGVYAGNPIGSR